jgi:hypothetical protein
VLYVEYIIPLNVHEPLWCNEYKRTSPYEAILFLSLFYVAIPFRSYPLRDDAKHANEIERLKMKQSLDAAQRDLEAERSNMAHQMRAEKDKFKEEFEAECQHKRTTLERELRSAKDRHEAQLSTERRNWEHEHTDMLASAEREASALKQVCDMLIAFVIAIL